MRLSVAGYEVAERELRFALPAPVTGDGAPSVSCWVRKDRVYLYSVACRQLSAETRARWDGLAEERGRPPRGEAVLARVTVTHYLLGLVRPLAARFWVFRPGADDAPQVR